MKAMEGAMRLALITTFCCVLGCQPSARWGEAQSAFTERCDAQTPCADGSSCVSGYCRRPAEAGEDYVPGLSCGDGLRQPWEPCDDGNNADIDECVSGCRIARCGDGFVRQGLPPNDSAFEACDDGNSSDYDGCLGDCQLARCGDGVRREDLNPGDEGYEACDDGNRDDWDACVDCQAARCGDGIVWDDEEQCDDGNDDDSDGCVAGCQVARCGDGLLRQDLHLGDPGYEECDDGNEADDDACGSDCYRNQRFNGAGASADAPGHSCAQILRDNPGSGDGFYWIDPDANRMQPPARVRCDMSTDGGGFSRLLQVTPELGLWDAWRSTLVGESDGAGAFGLPLRPMVDQASELEFYFARNGQRVTPIYSGLPEDLWDPFTGSTRIADGFEWHQPGGQPERCAVAVAHVEATWNWGVAGAEGCASTAEQGALLLGREAGGLIDAAVLFQAPGEADPSAFETVSVWLR